MRDGLGGHGSGVEIYTGTIGIWQEWAYNNQNPISISPHMAKPKGFSTMCWLGLILNGLYTVFALITAIYERIATLAKWPSLIELEIFQSDAQIPYIIIGGFVCGAQVAMLVDMLHRRINRIRGLVIAILATVALTYLDTLSIPEDPFNAWAMLIEFLLAAIPLAYFCRKSVYDYLKG